jgi:hypothetical protein
MQNFKLWLEENSSEEFNYPQNTFPRKLLGSGKFASVYETNHPDVIMRVEVIKSAADQADIKPQFHDQACEKIMAKPEIQATGGVAKIYNTQITEYDFQDEKNPLFITYKEKVDTNWITYFKSKYGQEAYKLIDQFNPHSWTEKKDKMITILEKFPETANLVKAIKLGIPVQDLTAQNVGLNSENNLVAIDC